MLWSQRTEVYCPWSLPIPKEPGVPMVPWSLSPSGNDFTSTLSSHLLKALSVPVIYQTPFECHQMVTFGYQHHLNTNTIYLLPEPASVWGHLDCVQLKQNSFWKCLLLLVWSHLGLSLLQDIIRRVWLIRVNSYTWNSISKTMWHLKTNAIPQHMQNLVLVCGICEPWSCHNAKVAEMIYFSFALCNAAVCLRGVCLNVPQFVCVCDCNKMLYMTDYRRAYGGWFYTEGAEGANIAASRYVWWSHGSLQTSHRMNWKHTCENWHQNDALLFFHI